jgi:mRNA-degrading endonuclease YafQ of YafQ-DinJ toxin-antitoxin module
VIRAAWDEGFKRSYKKRVRNNSRLKKKFWEKMSAFLENPFFPLLRTHKLSGKLAGQ